MKYILALMAVSVFIISIFFTDLIDLEASESVKRIIGLLMAIVFFNQYKVYELEDELKDA